MDTSAVHEAIRRFVLRSFWILVLAGPCANLSYGAVQTGSTVTLAWDPSSDTNVAGYKIYYGTTARSYTNTVTVGLTTNATVGGLVRGTKYYFTATAFNDAGLESDFSNEASYVVPLPPNQVPTLDPLPDITLYENSGAQQVSLTGISAGGVDVQPLTVTAVSSNPSLIPAPLVDYASPDGFGTLTLNPAPNRFGAAEITVTVNDGQSTNATVSRTFRVSISPSVAQLSLGSTVIPVGQPGSIPVNLSSSSPMTLVQIALDIPAGKISNLSLQLLAAEIDPATSVLTPQGTSPTTWVLRLRARSGQSFGTLDSTAIAQLSFASAANQSSTFVPFNVGQVTAYPVDSATPLVRPGQSGRAVLVGKEALLEANLAADGTRGLTIFGKPSATYAIEFSTSIQAPKWTRLPVTIPMSDYVQPVGGLDPAAGMIFYRAVEM
jgi:hypothetical protein